MKSLIRNSILGILFSTTITFFAAAEEISFESEVRVKRENQNGFEALKPGTALKLKAGESALVSTAQGFPMLIYAPTGPSAQVKVADVNLEIFAQDALRPQLEKSTREVVNSLRKIDSLIERREYDQALAALNPLRSKFPNISSVLFASATVNYLTNHRQTAIEDLQKGLELDPDDAAAKKLLARLKENK